MRGHQAPGAASSGGDAAERRCARLAYDTSKIAIRHLILIAFQIAFRSPMPIAENGLLIVSLFLLVRNQAATHLH
jgi:hypothetical protein